MAATRPPEFYRVRLSERARWRGERVLCQLLGWAGADHTLAHVRIVQSTVPAYPRGRTGLIKRAHLAPVRVHPADPAA